MKGFHVRGPEQSRSPQNPRLMIQAPMYSITNPDPAGGIKEILWDGLARREPRNSA